MICFFYFVLKFLLKNIEWKKYVARSNVFPTNAALVLKQAIAINPKSHNDNLFLNLILLIRINVMYMLTIKAFCKGCPCNPVLLNSVIPSNCMLKILSVLHGKIFIPKSRSTMAILVSNK